ncbi:hypothetical protein EBR57_00215 [bacterium]|nr:hypothetical protein [bacterium]
MKQHILAIALGIGLSVLTGCGQATSLTQPESMKAPLINVDARSMDWDAAINLASKNIMISVNTHSDDPVSFQFTTATISGRLVYRNGNGVAISEGQLGTAAVITDVTVVRAAEWRVNLDDMPDGTQFVDLEVIYYKQSGDLVHQSITVR